MLVKMKTSVNLVISWKGTAARLMCVLVGSPGHLVGRPHFEMCVTSLQVRVKSHGVFVRKSAQQSFFLLVCFE